MLRLMTLLLTIVLTSGVGEATKYPVTVKDCRGKAVQIAREPKRIISIAPSNTEILYALGLEKRVVGVTRYCDYPAAARRKPKVGDRTTSLEKVIFLRPDLVLAHGTLNDEAIRSIERHGFTVAAIDPKSLEQLMSDIKLVGRITNREKEAAGIVSRMSSTRRLVKREAQHKKSSPKVLVAVQGDPLWAAGPGTFVDEMIKLAGGTNLAADAKPGFNQFSAEAAVWREPDMIIYTTSADKSVFTRGLWSRTKAARQGHVYEVNPDILVRPGPRLVDGLKAIAKLIHPDVFDKL